jgi:flagellar hook-length control protein FliK
MQILELLGSAAPAPAAASGATPNAHPNALKVSEVSTENAFAKHLDEAMGNREVIKAEDAKRHGDDFAARKQEKNSERVDAERRDELKADNEVDDVDEVREEPADEEVSQAANGAADQDKQSDTGTQVAATNAGGILAAVLAGAENHKKHTDAIFVKADVVTTTDTAGLVDTDLSQSPDAAIIAAVPEAVKSVAGKASENAAFNDNDNDMAAAVMSDSAMPFVVDPNKPVEEQVALTVDPNATQIKVVDTDFSEDSTIAAEVISLAAAPVIQAEAPKVQDKSAPTVNQASGKSQKVQNVQKNDGPTDVRPETISDAPATAGTDARLEAMRVAEAAHKEAALRDAVADSIFSRFNAGQSAAASGAPFVAAQSGAQQPGNAATAAANTPAADSTGNSPGVETQVSARQSVQTPQGPQSGTLPPSSEMDNRVLNTLVQSRPAAAPAPAPQASATATATAAAATRGAEAASTTNVNASTPTAAAVGAPTETSTPNATQAAAAARPPAPPTPPKTPQVQVALQIAKAVQNGTDRISIRLNPAELGRIDIKLDVAQSGQVAATITVDRPETLELLRNDSRALEQALADAGLETDSDDLSFNLRDHDANGNRLAKDENADDLLASEDDDIDQLEMALAEARRNSAANRALDINV